MLQRRDEGRVTSPGINADAVAKAAIAATKRHGGEIDCDLYEALRTSAWSQDVAAALCWLTGWRINVEHVLWGNVSLPSEIVQPICEQLLAEAAGLVRR